MAGIGPPFYFKNLVKLSLKMGQPSLFYVYFCLFRITQFNILMKEYMVCLGLEPGATGWKGQTNPLSYGGTHGLIFSPERDFVVSVHFLVRGPVAFERVLEVPVGRVRPRTEERFGR